MNETEKKEFFQRVHIGDLLDVDYVLEIRKDDGSVSRPSGGIFAFVEMLSTRSVILSGKDPFKEIPNCAYMKCYIGIDTIVRYHPEGREEYRNRLSNK